MSTCRRMMAWWALAAIGWAVGAAAGAFLLLLVVSDLIFLTRRPKSPIRSRLFRGYTRHTRSRPIHFSFSYGINYMSFDVDELPALSRSMPLLFGHNRFALYSLYDGDYGLRTAGSLRTKLTRHLSDEGCDVSDLATIELVTVPRLLGLVFNPVSFYFTFHSDGSAGPIVAEVNNTFGETHTYVLDARNARGPPVAGYDHRFVVERRFHVSPFNDRSGSYEIHCRDIRTRLAMTFSMVVDGEKRLIATVQGAGARSLSPHALLSHLVLFPATSLLTTPRILLEAGKLAFRHGMPIFAKPIPVDGSLRTAAPSAAEVQCADQLARALEGAVAVDMPSGEALSSLAARAEGGDQQGARLQLVEPSAAAQLVFDPRLETLVAEHAVGGWRTRSMRTLLASLLEHRFIARGSNHYPTTDSFERLPPPVARALFALSLEAPWPSVRSLPLQRLVDALAADPGLGQRSRLYARRSSIPAATDQHDSPQASGLPPCDTWTALLVDALYAGEAGVVREAASVLLMGLEERCAAVASRIATAHGASLLAVSGRPQAIDTFVLQPHHLDDVDVEPLVRLLAAGRRRKYDVAIFVGVEPTGPFLLKIGHYVRRTVRLGLLPSPASHPTPAADLAHELNTCELFSRDLALATPFGRVGHMVRLALDRLGTAYLAYITKYVVAPHQRTLRTQLAAEIVQRSLLPGLLLTRSGTNVQPATTSSFSTVLVSPLPAWQTAHWVAAMRLVAMNYHSGSGESQPAPHVTDPELRNEYSSSVELLFEYVALLVARGEWVLALVDTTSPSIFDIDGADEDDAAQEGAPATQVDEPEREQRRRQLFDDARIVLDPTE